jgi:hypothetical protein
VESQLDASQNPDSKSQYLVFYQKEFLNTHLLEGFHAKLGIRKFNNHTISKLRKIDMGIKSRETFVSLVNLPSNLENLNN